MYRLVTTTKLTLVWLCSVLMLKVVLLLLKRKGKTGLPLPNQVGSQTKLSLEDVPCDRIDFAEILVASQFSEPFHGYCIAGLFAFLKYRFWWRKLLQIVVSQFATPTIMWHQNVT